MNLPRSERRRRPAGEAIRTCGKVLVIYRATEILELSHTGGYSPPFRFSLLISVSFWWIHGP
jgi:hypothetical protein